jgi:hypothetical protein
MSPLQHVLQSRWEENPLSENSTLIPQKGRRKEETVQTCSDTWGKAVSQPKT